jgi:glutaredoxin-like protein
MVVEMDDETKAQVKELFGELKENVTIHLFVKEENCLYCNDTTDLVNLVAENSDKVSVAKHSIESEMAKQLGIEHAPGIALEASKRYNIKFYGIPAGHEFGALIGSIVDVSKGEAPLPPDIIEDIASIDKAINIKVFVTPQCPYCPAMTRLAHQAAIINPLITSEMVESLEFQELATKYEVFGVPKTIFNEDVSAEGLTPPEMFVEKLYDAIE